jgi:hypothetical protein
MKTAWRRYRDGMETAWRPQEELDVPWPSRWPCGAGAGLLSVGGDRLRRHSKAGQLVAALRSRACAGAADRVWRAPWEGGLLPLLGLWTKLAAAGGPLYSLGVKAVRAQVSAIPRCGPLCRLQYAGIAGDLGAPWRPFTAQILVQMAAKRRAAARPARH